MIPLTVPEFDAQDERRVHEVLRSKSLVQGPMVRELEQKAELLIGQPVRAVSNGTATMHLALKILGVGPGDEVIVPAFSYVATANVVELVGAKPVFVDIDLDDFNIKEEAIESQITEKTKAIIPVHEFGFPAKIADICRLATKYSVSVIEDCACAIGASVDGKPVGTFGDFGSFSMHPRKILTSGEGGLLTCKNREWLKEIEMLRSHGQSIESGEVKFLRAGFNYRMTDIQAALVVQQIDRLSEVVERRRELVLLYSKLLRDVEKIKLPAMPGLGFNHVWQSFHLLMETKEARDALKAYLWERGVQSGLGAQCIPFQDYYQNRYGLDCYKLFPNAQRAFETGLVLPLFSSLGEDQVLFICSQIKEFFSDFE